MSSVNKDDDKPLDDIEAGAARDLENIMKEIDAASRAWGVRPDHLEGRFVAALVAVIGWLVRFILAAFKTGRALLRETKGVADAEVSRLRMANEGAAILASQLRHISLVIEVERDKALARVVEGIGPEIIDRLKPWMVVREMEWNRSQKWRRGQRTAVLAMVLLGMGYGFRAWQDAEATSALARCVLARVASAVDGHLVCDVTNLLPRNE
jgi:hypothetical protein